MKTNTTRVFLLAAISVLISVGCKKSEETDAGVPDAGPIEVDSGTPDAGTSDAGPEDDAGPVDAGPYDSGVPAGRSFRGAPPVVPHDAFGCGINCLDCHATGAGAAPMTSHPERRMCTMCHLFADQTLEPFVPNIFRP